jgi:hypothetical protein
MSENQFVYWLEGILDYYSISYGENLNYLTEKAVIHILKEVELSIENNPNSSILNFIHGFLSAYQVSNMGFYEKAISQLRVKIDEFIDKQKYPLPVVSHQVTINPLPFYVRQDNT